MPRRSERLLRRNADAIAASCSGRFMVEATTGSLSSASFSNYLAIEEAFVKTAARVAGFCIWRAPDWGALIAHADTLQHLLGDQLDYFAARRNEWVADPIALPAVLSRADQLSTHVLGTIETAGYPAAVVGMFAAESLYLSWCGSAARVSSPGRDPAVTAWIDLHVSEEFVAQVEFLARRVDEIPDDIPNARLDEWFTEMLLRENAFHDAVYL